MEYLITNLLCETFQINSILKYKNDLLCKTLNLQSDILLSFSLKLARGYG